jgi:hypothetical protein
LAISGNSNSLFRVRAGNACEFKLRLCREKRLRNPTTYVEQFFKDGLHVSPRLDGDSMDLASASVAPRAPSRTAQYVRMSTEHQQSSTENQLDIVRQYAVPGTGFSSGKERR